MRRLTFALTLLAAAFVAGQSSQAADSKVTTTAPAAASVVVVEPAAPPPDAVLVTTPADTVIVTKPPPRVQYGCKRIWRCDLQVCEWRRGCWGIYGYMEGPYYSQELAKRQWERDGWPTSGTRTRTRAAIEPSVAK